MTQLDLFRDQPSKSEGDAGGKPASPSEKPARVYQLAELPGETFEDIFVPPEAA